MRRYGSNIVQVVVVIAFFLIVVSVLFPVGTKSRGSARRASCQSNLKQIAMSVKQYMRDSDEHLPLVSTSSKQGWTDSLQPYLKIGWNIFQCPSESTPAAPQTTDYFYNARLAGQINTKIPSPILSIMLGDGLGDVGANAHIWELPFGWTDTDTSPARRHLDGANYAFVDGHVKWLRPSKVTNKSPQQGMPTFAIR